MPAAQGSLTQGALAPVSSSSATTVTVPVGGLMAAITLPAASSGAGTVTIAGSTAQPSGTPALGIMRTSAEAVGTKSAPSPLAFFTFTSSDTDTFGRYPAFAITLPAGTVTTGVTFYLAYLAAGASAWIEPTAGPGTVSAAGSTPIISFAASSFSSAIALPFTFQSGQPYQFALYEINGTVASPTPTPAPSASATAGATALPTVATTPGACSTSGGGPSICNITPTSGAVGSTVLINGNNFAAPLSVTFGGGVAATGSFTATQVTAVVPNGAQSGPITITTGAGTANSATFTVTH